MLSSSADGAGTLASQAGSIYPWQVAQLQQPPQSPKMPGTELSMAARMTEIPSLASTVCSVPSCSMKTTLNTDAPWNVQLSYSHWDRISHYESHDQEGTVCRSRTVQRRSRRSLSTG